MVVVNGPAQHRELERLVRAVAILLPLLVSLVGRAFGVSLAEVMGSSLALTNPLTFGLVDILVPGAMGVFLAWYIIRTARRSEEAAIRVLMMIGTLIITQFADVYLGAVLDHGFQTTKHLAPNIAFTIGIGLYAILNFQSTKKQVA